MKFEIKHEIKGRMRVRMHQKRMTCREADILLFISVLKDILQVLR